MKVKNKLIHLNCQIKKKTFIYKNKNTWINQLMLNNLIHSFFGGGTWFDFNWFTEECFVRRFLKGMHIDS